MEQDECKSVLVEDVELAWTCRKPSQTNPSTVHFAWMGSKLWRVHERIHPLHTSFGRISGPKMLQMRSRWQALNQKSKPASALHPIRSIQLACWLQSFHQSSGAFGRPWPSNSAQSYPSGWLQLRVTFRLTCSRCCKFRSSLRPE